MPEDQPPEGTTPSHNGTHHQNGTHASGLDGLIHEWPPLESAANAQAYLFLLKSLVGVDQDGQPDYSYLYRDDNKTRLGELRDLFPDLYKGEFQPWAERLRIFWPTLDQEIANARLKKLAPISLPYVPKPLMPALPHSVTFPPDVWAGAAPWLERYCAYSEQWSPRAAEGFHQAIGLWILSTIAARRIYADVGDRLYPGLYIALIARSTLYAKTTTGKLGRTVLDRCTYHRGRSPLLLPDRSSPQALIKNMSARIPNDFHNLDQDTQDLIQARLKFAAQRGWYFEEWGGMMAQMARRDGSMADFHSLLRSLDDGYDEFENDTIARGMERLNQPYLALLANATPHDLHQYMEPYSPYWHDGFWPRFAFIVPLAHEAPSDADRPLGNNAAPQDIIGPLAAWHSRLGMPQASIIEKTNKKGDGTGEYRAEIDPLPQRAMQIAPAAWAAYNAYGKALNAMIRDGAVPDDLASCYGRYHTKAMRIAMLLASLDASQKGLPNDQETVQLEHWAYAQQITEHWREMLHTLIGTVGDATAASADEQLEDTIETILSSTGPQTARQLQRHTHKTTSAAMVRVLNSMVASGRILKYQDGRKTYYNLDDSPDELYNNIFSNNNSLNGEREPGEEG